MNQYIQLV